MDKNVLLYVFLVSGILLSFAKCEDGGEADEGGEAVELDEAVEVVKGGEVLEAHAAEGSNEFYEKKFNETIQCLRKKLQRNTPPYDPLGFNDTVLLNMQNNKFLYLKLRLDKLIIQGLLDFDVVSINLSSTLKLDIHYHFKRIYITSLHGGNINLLGLLGYRTKGDLKMEILNADLRTTTQYNVNAPLIKTYSAKLKLGNINLDMTGINDVQTSEEYSELVTKFGAGIVNLVPDYVSNEISPPIKRVLDDRIGDLSFLEFLEIIMKPSCDF